MALPQAHSERHPVEVRTERQVTQAILQMAEHIAAAYFPRKIYWTDFWDRLDGATLADGSAIDLGDQYDTDAMKKIRRHVERKREDQ